MSQSKKIGILTSGGDCPGLNAAIRAVVKCATQKGWEMYGIPYGTDGFIGVHEGRYRPEDLKLRAHGYDMPGLLQGLDILQFLSGSILGSLSRGHPEQEGVAEKILGGYQQLGLDAIITIGGDGSLDIIHDLAQRGGWNLVAIPKTIDNDVPLTERTLGFDTAISTVTTAVYDLTFTAASHDRIMIVQAMGRDAGHLALHSGIAGGADIILIPELVPAVTTTVLDSMCEHISHLRQEGRKFALVVVSEGVRTAAGKREKYIGDYVAEQLRIRSQELCTSGNSTFCGLTDIDTRSTVLGHIQRSGTPSASDRLLANAFGTMAIQLIEAEHYNQLVVWANGKVCSRSLDEVIPCIKQCHREKRCSNPVKPDDMMVLVARSLGIYLGEPIIPDSTAEHASSLEKDCVILV
ncbi:MAG: 6-phosphofructokinase [Synechococcales cyanobacterium T60_A2020_003]|nr:6-phosphofructokinase [Synechococcales cyanobacterium T60_A2020_003]